MKVGVNNNRKGLVILAVLWTVVVLMVIVAVLGRKSRLDMKVCMARMDAVRGKWACRAGVEKAVAVLNEDETENDTLLDTWSDNDEDFNDVMLERCLFNIRVVDEASKLNINFATKDQLMGLPYMLEEIADAIIDWRDTDDMPSGAGVESGYYEGLELGYMARNGPFRTIRELLLVKDVTDELFYGEDTNFNGQLDYNENDGDESPPNDDGDTELDLGWIAYLTCYTPDEKVNVNTAPEAVLTALLGGDDEAVRTALEIINYRENAENGIEKPSDLTDNGVMSDSDFSKIEDYLTVSSDVFTVYCVAAADRNGTPGAQSQTEVVINRSSRPYEVLFLYQ
ncbi:MAG: type II secretion system protein GspK, partial [Planctomycetota bacterium]|nr:type II secretion system protein GspK [Planctomycetota bacterium]